MFKTLSRGVRIILNNQSLNRYIFRNTKQVIGSFNSKNERNHSYSHLGITPAFVFLGLLSLGGSNDNNKDKVELSRASKYNFIADVVEIVMPSVVNIETSDLTPFGSRQNLGSGFIVSEDGLIFTNAHVVGNQLNVTVKLHDGKQAIGRVIKIDQLADVAIVKIDKTNLKSLKLEDSNKVRPGEFVIALGSPLTLTNSVTAGIVSNVSRMSSTLGLRNDLQYIQTDALITFGNSGGPLINLDGKVIGMNTMMAHIDLFNVFLKNTLSISICTVGIGFAVPSNYMQKLLDEVNEYKNKHGSIREFKRYYIGVKMLTLEPELIEVIRLRDKSISIPDDVKYGCLIVAIRPNSPAHRAGLRYGDIITKVNGKEISKASDLFKVLETTPHLHLTISRNSHEMRVTLNAEEL